MQCPREIETLKGVGYEVKGIEEARKGGGLHHVLRKERTGRILCPHCMNRLKYGIGPEQGKLA